MQINEEKLARLLKKSKTAGYKMSYKAKIGLSRTTISQLRSSKKEISSLKIENANKLLSYLLTEEIYYTAEEVFEIIAKATESVTFAVKNSSGNYKCFSDGNLWKVYYFTSDIFEDKYYGARHSIDGTENYFNSTADFTGEAYSDERILKEIEHMGEFGRFVEVHY